MKTYEKALDWMGLVLDLGKANGLRINEYKLYGILFIANETMREMTGLPLFKEEPIAGYDLPIYDSIKRAFNGVVGSWPITYYESCTLDVDLIQVNAIRKAMKLPLVHADDF